MSIKTNLAGRLRNTPLPVTSGLLPLYEAVVNSIHGIEEARLDSVVGRIDIKILRKLKQATLDLGGQPKKKGPEALEDIIGFEITDNGIGFTDDNMASFHTLDSEHKSAKGCRGVGRLLWLKAFDKVEIKSVYRSKEGVRLIRKFQFSAHNGIDNEHTAETSDELFHTSVLLEGFYPKYREYARKTPQAIAASILEHCLWYFIRAGSAPEITVQDDGEVISLTELFEGRMHSDAVSETLTIKERVFDLTHVKLRTNSLLSHTIAYCADNRLVYEEKLAGKVAGLHGKLSDGDGEFVYSCYVNSPFLNESVRPERTGFEIVEKTEGLFADTELSLSDIREAVIASSKKQLSDHLSKNLSRAKERVDKFIAQKAPRYRPILSRIPEASLNIDPDISDKELDITLHKHLADIEREMLAEGHEIVLAGVKGDSDEYKKRLSEYLSKAADIKKSDLANYVSHRRVILDLLESAIKRLPGGAYAREDVIHNFIMPMQVTSDDVLTDTCNLWLVDERLAFHNYLASDKTLRSMPITGSDSTKEPDLCALNVYDNPILVSDGSKLPLASITVVEIKRPMRNDARAGEEDDPVEQAIGYLDRIRSGGVMTAEGRPVPESPNIPGFCYVIADLTPKLKQRCLIHHDLKWTHDKLGFFGYKQNCNAYVSVLSFEQLVNGAKERNRAFFDKLGLPCS